MSRMDKKEKMLREAEQAAREDVLEADAPQDAQTPEAPETPEAPQGPTQAELDAARAQAEEYLNLAQRVQADFDNFRRRNETVRADAYGEGLRALAAELLPVMDNLERAVDAAQASPDGTLREGVALVLRQLGDLFQKKGITPIDRLGEPFDPQLENALMQGSPEEGEPGTVCQVFQKGYQLDGHVLRHAMVKVVPEG